MADAETQQRIKFLEDRVVLLEDVIKALLQGKDTANYLTAFQLPTKQASNNAAKKEDEIKITKPQPEPVTKVDDRSEIIRAHYLPASKQKELFETKAQTTTTTQQPAKPADAKPKPAKKTAFQKLMEQQGEEV